MTDVNLFNLLTMSQLIKGPSVANPKSVNTVCLALARLHTEFESDLQGWQFPYLTTRLSGAAASSASRFIPELRTEV